MADIITGQENTRAVASPGTAAGRKHAVSLTRTGYRLLGLVAALAIALTAFISGTGTAKADIGDVNVGHVWMNLSGYASVDQANQYSQLISSLRAAAGHGWQGSTMMTQPNSDSLIRLDLTVDGNTLQLWLTPNDLYLRGWTDTQGNTYSFNDYNLRGMMQTIVARNGGGQGLLPAAASSWNQYYTLPYGSNYNSLSQAAQRSRDTMTVSYNDLWWSAENLALARGAIDQPSTLSYARSLMFMIQYTSEAARFNDVFGVMSAISGNNNRRDVGIGALQQELENSWAQITQFADNVVQNAGTAAIYVGPTVGWLYTLWQVNQYLAEGIGLTSQISPRGDWNVAEI
jgi:hypothetical protein